jgi:uncharacterized Tic20 family protein
MNNIAEELAKLEALKNSQSITEEEFLQAKKVLLNQSEKRAKSDNFSINNWCMLIHLSQFSGYFFPLAGFVVPIILWQMKKDESEQINQHGINVTNWIISSLIYFIVSAILCVVIIGIPMLVGVGILALVFPIIGGVKANNGEIWKYPLSISFFK